MTKGQDLAMVPWEVTTGKRNQIKINWLKWMSYCLIKHHPAQQKLLNTHETTQNCPVLALNFKELDWDGITQSPTSCSSSEFTSPAGWTPAVWWQPLPFLVGISDLITSVKSRTTGTWQPQITCCLCFPSALPPEEGSCFMPLGNGLGPWEVLEALLRVGGTQAPAAAAAPCCHCTRTCCSFQNGCAETTPLLLLDWTPVLKHLVSPFLSRNPSIYPISLSGLDTNICILIRRTLWSRHTVFKAQRYLFWR